MRKAWLFCMLVLFCAVAGCGGGQRADVPKISVVAFAPDPLIDNAVQGIRDGLADLGYVDGKDVVVEYNDAKGEMATISTIVQMYMAGGADIIVPMTTPGLVATAAVVEQTDQSVVFCTVYNPYAAGVATSPSDHIPNIVGVASPPPVAATLDVIEQLSPEARRLGVIYNPGEANSTYALDLYREACRARGMMLVERTVSASSDVQQAAQSLVGQVDVFLVIGDNTVGVSLEAIVEAAETAGVMAITNDSEWVDRGAAVSVGPNWYDSAYVAAGLMAQILEGADPADLEIITHESHDLAFNLAAAERQGLAVPQVLLDKATHVVE